MMNQDIGIGTRVVVRHRLYDDTPLYEGIVIALTENFYKVRDTSDKGLFSEILSPNKEEWLPKNRVEQLL